MNILFYLSKKKVDRLGFAPIYTRITIRGVRAEFSTSIKVRVKDWDSKKNRVRGNSDSAILANSKLTAIRDKLDLIYLDRERKNLPVTARIIKEAYFNPTHAITVNYMFDVLIEERRIAYESTMKQLDRIKITKPQDEKKWLKLVKRKKRNYQKWKRNYAHFQGFMKSQRLKSLFIEELNIDIANQYFQYLTIEAALANNTAVRTARPLKTVIQKAIEKEFISVNKLELWSLSDDAKPKSKYIWLNDKELAKLENYRFTSEALQKVADLYIFQSYTGFRYSDLETFDFELDTFMYDGQIYISKEEFKTDENALLPLFSKALEVLKKYGMKLPKPPNKDTIISNAKYNVHIKEIAKILGIKKHLTTHTARVTAGMKWLNNDIPIEIVARMLGDNPETVRKHYAYILPDAIHKATEKLRQSN